MTNHYLVRKVSTDLYLFCKQLPPSLRTEGNDCFYLNGTQHNRLSLLYRIETAVKQGNTVVGADPTIDALVKGYAGMLSEIRFKKKQKAIEEKKYGWHKKEGTQSKAPVE